MCARACTHPPNTHIHTCQWEEGRVEQRSERRDRQDPYTRPPPHPGVNQNICLWGVRNSSTAVRTAGPPVLTPTPCVCVRLLPRRHSLAKATKSASRLGYSPSCAWFARPALGFDGEAPRALFFLFSRGRGKTQRVIEAHSHTSGGGRWHTRGVSDMGQGLRCPLQSEG